MITELLTVLLSAEILRLAWGYHHKTNKIIKKIKRNKITNIKPKEYPNLIINIPVYMEQNIISSTLDFWTRVNYPKKKLTINIITTDKEGKGENSTFSIVEKTIKRYRKNNIHNFQHLHCPDMQGKKAHQLNFALKMSSVKLTSKTYFGIYDSDSRPSLNTFMHLAKRTEEKYPYVIQQFSLYLKNYDKIGLFGKAVAIFQTRWTLTHEYYSSLLDSAPKTKNKKLLYTIGHGLFIRFDLLKKIKGFPEETSIEDLALGYRLSFLNIKINPLAVFDNCEVPSSFTGFVKQNSMWFSGEGYLLKNKKKIESLTNQMISIKDFMLGYIIRKYQLFRWGFGGIITAIIILINIFQTNKYSLGLILFALFFFSIAGVRKIINNKELFSELSNKCMLDNTNYFKIIPFMFLRTLIINFGPLLHYFKIIKFKLFSNQYYHYKTER